jgi:hypothetical protein
VSDWETRMAERTAAKRATAWAEAELRNAVENDAPEPGAAEIMLNLPPRIDATRCGHGERIGDDPDEVSAPSTWGPEDFKRCLCCEQTYLCIGHGTYSWAPQGYSSAESHMDEHLCSGCGGKVRHARHGMFA